MMTCLSTSNMLVLPVLLLASWSMTASTTTAFAFAPSVSSSSSVSTNSKSNSNSNSKSFLQRQPSSSLLLLLQRRRGLVAVSSTVAPTATATAATTTSTTETTAPNDAFDASFVPPPNARPVITKITSEAQLTAYLNADSDRVTILQFHAAWCKSCQKFGRLYLKLAADHADWERIPDRLSRAAIVKAATGAASTDTPSQAQDIVKDGAARMASIEWGANTQLCRSFGITKLPTVHFYKGPVKLAGFAAGPNKMQMVKDTLQHYMDVSETELEFEQEMKEGEQLLQDAIHMPTTTEAEAATNTAAIDDAATPSKNLWNLVDQWKLPK
jgi:thiol-disulfide isomerase/thioredoxin